MTSEVQLVSDPSVHGIVLAVNQVGPVKKYTVFINGAKQIYFEGQIDPIKEQNAAYHWVDLETLISRLSAYQINHPSSTNLYSLNTARIDFVPYQFRPALKLIKADEPRILVADSVGVGKTIEAGLILKELEARNDIENVLIICPKPLVTERKWELEMQRFDEDFIPLRGEDLRQIISDTDRDGVWPTRYSKCIIPYSILDNRVYSGEDCRKGKRFGLEELDPSPHFDLVIVDEAHHIRNGSMDKDKAFAYKCVKYFCDHADAVVMLTATPVQTGDDDLFTLLNVLRPDMIMDKETFELMSKPNAFITKCAGLVRAAQDGWQEEALMQLYGLLSTQWGEKVIYKNPVYSSVIERLKVKKISREERVELITDIETLHSFNTMLNRTRRRDIQDFCVRRPQTISSHFTEEQQKLHDELLSFERDALSMMHDRRFVPFMMSTIRRQAASCIFGLAPYINDIISRRFEQMADDPDIDLDKSDMYDAAANVLVRRASHIIKLAQNLPKDDPKFDQMLRIVMEKQKQENNKIILFSTFRHTLRYLKSRLEAHGIRVEQVDGSVKDEDRRILRNRFELPKNNINAIDVMMFTEVGSEGLDYQFCNTMINYDLPWNPMRIEQRIGRIDRRGQISEAVNIYNMITEGTVDADIYYRCLWRIGVFEESVGECEKILGGIEAQVREVAENYELTEEERQAKLEQIADNEIRKVQELHRLEDAEKELFGFDLSEHMMSKEVQEAESPWLSQRSLEILVNCYLANRLGENGCQNAEINKRYIWGDSSIKRLRLPPEARKKLRDDLAELPNIKSSAKRKWEQYLKGNERNQRITFDSETASRNQEVFFITTVHPLVRQAARYFAFEQKTYINLRYDTDSIPAGDYPFVVYAWNYTGINPHVKLIAICENADVEKEIMDILQVSSAVTSDAIVPEDTWDIVEAAHAQKWMIEKKKYKEQAKSIEAYKKQSLENSYRNQCRKIEKQLNEAFGPNIRRMKQGELNNVVGRYEQKRLEIEQMMKKVDIHTRQIANGIVHIGGV